MATEIKVWGKGRSGLWSLGTPVDIPHDYAEITPGDAYITRHVKLRSEVVYLRMKKSKRLSISELVGILAPKHVVDDVRAEAQRTIGERKARNAVAARARCKKEAKLNEQRVEILRVMLPNIPADDAERIVQHAFEVGSGRVGRTSALDDKEKLHAATIAHIRHCYTEYDELMDGGMERDAARECVGGQIRTIYDGWAFSSELGPELSE